MVGVEHHGLEPVQYCSAKEGSVGLSSNKRDLASLGNNRCGANVRSQPRDVCGRDLESSLSSSRIKGYRKPCVRNANGELLRDATNLHWSSDAKANELLVSLIAEKGNSRHTVALS